MKYNQIQFFKLNPPKKPRRHSRRRRLHSPRRKKRQMRLQPFPHRESCEQKRQGRFAPNAKNAFPGFVHSLNAGFGRVQEGAIVS